MNLSYSFQFPAGVLSLYVVWGKKDSVTYLTAVTCLC